MGKDTLKSDENIFEEQYPEIDETDGEEYDLCFDTYYGEREITRKELKELFDLPSLDDVKEDMYLDFHYRGLGNGAAREIAKKLNNKIKKGVFLDLSHCEIGGDGAHHFYGIKLEEGAELDLRNNHIGGLWGAGLVFNIKFSNGATLNLSDNEIDGTDLNEYYYNVDNSTHINLPKGATLNLSDNNIRDKGAEVLKKTVELEDGAKLFLVNNGISDKMKQELKEWEKSYHDKGINCDVIV